MGNSNNLNFEMPLKTIKYLKSLSADLLKICNVGKFCCLQIVYLVRCNRSLAVTGNEDRCDATVLRNKVDQEVPISCCKAS